MEIDNNILKTIKITPILDSLKLENFSDDEYFSEKFSNYISNSRLGILKKEGAKAFFEGFKKQDYNYSFDFGGKLHQLVLQPESYELINVFKPTAKAGIVADYLYKLNGIASTDDDIKVASIKCNYYKDKLTTKRLSEFKQKAEPYWRDRYIYEQNNPFTEGDKERLYTDEKSFGLLTSCIESLNKNEEIQKLLRPKGLLEEPYHANERTILLDIKAEIPDYEPRVFKLKAKLDNFIVDKEENKIVVNDLKTTSKLIKDFDPSYFSYQREIAGYSWLLKLCSNKFFQLENPKVEGNFLVVSTVPSNEEIVSNVYPMTRDLFKSGWKEYSYLLKTVIYLNIVKGYEFA